MSWFLKLRRLFSTAGREALILWYAFGNPATPRAIKAGSLLLFLYLLSPIDILPDFALLLGWADDLAILLLGIPFLVNKLPPDVLAEAGLRADQKLGRFSRRPAGAR